MSLKKLYRLADKSFGIFSHVDWDGRVVTVPAGRTPMLRWPDGRWCTLANLFIQELAQQGLSRRDRGGTLLTYATQLSHLIRFCFANSVDFIDLTDSQFTLFMRTLQGPFSSCRNGATRDNRSIASIGRISLSFLARVGEFHGTEDFIGNEGRIRASRQERGQGRSSTSKAFQPRSWSHRALPIPSAERKRAPVSSDVIAKLRDAVLRTSSTTYLRRRRYMMLMLLEITGARRSEVASLTVASVRAAAMMSAPMLRMTTAKTGGNIERSRFVPISRVDIGILEEFIEKNRKGAIRRSCGAGMDDGYLLVSETTGMGLRPNTITQEVAALATASGLNVRVGPHMFRHRHITKLFLALIEQHQFENPDDFRRALIDVETLKREVQQWTGHSNIHSLDCYIHLAFDEMSSFRKSVGTVLASRAIDAAKNELSAIERDMHITTTNKDMLRRLNSVVNALKLDLCRSDST